MHTLRMSEISLSAVMIFTVLTALCAFSTTLRLPPLSPATCRAMATSAQAHHARRSPLHIRPSVYLLDIAQEGLCAGAVRDA